MRSRRRLLTADFLDDYWLFCLRERRPRDLDADESRYWVECEFERFSRVVVGL